MSVVHGLKYYMWQILFSLLSSFFFPLIDVVAFCRPARYCQHVRRIPLTPTSSTMTCTTPLTSVLPPTDPSIVASLWRSVHSVELAIALSSRGRFAVSQQ